MKHKVRMRDILIILLTLLCLLIAGYSGVKIWGYCSEWWQTHETYNELSQFVVFDETGVQKEPETAGAENGEHNDRSTVNRDQSEVEESSEEQEIVPAELFFPKVDFGALASINSEVIGWIYDGGRIHYPIAQGQDNEYYITHMFDGTENPNGSIFMDCRNSSDFSDFNSILYGHCMKNGTMFRSLMNYKDQEYYEKHPEILVMTEDTNFRARIFAGYVTGSDNDAWQISFADDEEKQKWINDRISHSYIETGVVPGASDRILTLSTCSYEFENAFFVLFGVLEEE